MTGIKVGTITVKLQAVNVYYERPGSFRVESFTARYQESASTCRQLPQDEKAAQTGGDKEMEDRVEGRIVWI